ncbi:hypothetical protein DPMN_177297 [Dreissena polymorpha]|uniref:Uncharacterized protein n=2 Tax=Dreissena polymorpha TaxID=45954 RepID=A0A9D4E8R0_DREPO|nr:hypothetical protein DPMN_177297 [Dreissena polymorpha]
MKLIRITYIIGFSTKNFGNSVFTSSSHKVSWVDGVNPYMYVSLGHQVLKCHHGTDKNKKRKLEKEKNAGLLQRIDSDVASKIKELVVEEGVANVEEMQRHLTSFVMKNVTPAPSRTKRRFAPTKK